jgi:hypothetical protein
MSEPLTPQRNLERVLGLWPSAGLTADWKGLFLSRFRDLNQDWLRTAIENVKLAKGSHVPELKWFAEEFEQVRKHAGAVARDEPRTLEDKAQAKAIALEREREEVEAERMKIRRWMTDIPPASLDQIRDAMRRIAFLRTLAKGTERPVAEWPAFTLGMAHAIAVRDGIGGAR